MAVLAPAEKSRPTSAPSPPPLESAAESEDSPTADVAWIRNAADLRDPPVVTRWPDVDIDESDDADPDDAIDEIGETGKALA